MPWRLNRNICQSLGGDLVSIETEQEWNIIKDEIGRRNIKKSHSKKWSIGLTKKAGNWTWVNGRPLTIRKWGIGEPSGEHNAAFIYELESNGGRACFLVVVIVHVGETCTPIFVKSPRVSFFFFCAFFVFYYCYYIFE